MFEIKLTALRAGSEAPVLGKRDKKTLWLYNSLFNVFCNFALIAFSFSACNSYDSDHIPFLLKGLDVWVYDNVTNREYYGGRVKANYFSKDDAIAECGNLAYAIAGQYRLSEWSYVCCTGQSV